MRMPSSILVAAVIVVQFGNPTSVSAQQSRRLPPTNLDSFVYQAGGAAEAIYGDEGTNGPPPYSGFGQGHRIAAGITGRRNAGLTTGHGSQMPTAWGAIGEMCQSGPNNGGNVYSGTPESGFDLGQALAMQTANALNQQIDAINDQIASLMNMHDSLNPAQLNERQALEDRIDDLINRRNGLVDQLPNR